MCSLSAHSSKSFAGSSGGSSVSAQLLAAGGVGVGGLLMPSSGRGLGMGVGVGLGGMADAWAPRTIAGPKLRLLELSAYVELGAAPPADAGAKLEPARAPHSFRHTFAMIDRNALVEDPANEVRALRTPHSHSALESLELDFLGFLNSRGLVDFLRLYTTQYGYFVL